VANPQLSLKADIGGKLFWFYEGYQLTGIFHPNLHFEKNIVSLYIHSNNDKMYLTIKNTVDLSYEI